TVVVDDGASGVDEGVRGDDLASSAPRQAYLARLLGIREPEWVHVPLVLNSERKRLAKRDGAVTDEQRCAQGWPRPEIFAGQPGAWRLADAGTQWADTERVGARADSDRREGARASYVPAHPAGSRAGWPESLFARRGAGRRSGGGGNDHGSDDVIVDRREGVQ